MNSSALLKTIAMAALVSGFACASFADVDSDVARARTTKGGALIKCSPDGVVDGTVDLSTAMKNAKRGSVIRFYPGKYNPMELPIFDEEGLIIEGDGSGGYVDMPLIAYGRDTVIRNIFIRTIEIEDATVVDTKAHYIMITSGGTRSGTPVVYNCAFNGMTIYDNLQNVAIHNTSIVNNVDIDDSKVGQIVYQAWNYGGGGGYGYYNMINFGKMVKEGKVEFERCVIRSGADLFGNANKMIKLTMKDNLVYFGHSAIPQEKDKPAIKELDGLDDHFTVKAKLGKENVFDKPKFKNMDPWTWGWNMNADCFILVPESPAYGKGWGVNIGDKGMPVPATPGKK